MKEQIIKELNKRHDAYLNALSETEDIRSKTAIDLIARLRECSELIKVVESIDDEIKQNEYEIYRDGYDKGYDDAMKSTCFHYDMPDKPHYFKNYEQNPDPIPTGVT